MFHAHQDDVVEQQEIAQVRDLEDRPARGARGGQTAPGGGYDLTFRWPRLPKPVFLFLKTLLFFYFILFFLTFNYSWPLG